MLAAKLSGDALPRPQMQVKLAGFARAELGKQAVTLSNLVMGVDDALLSGNGSVQLGAVPKVEFDLKGRSWISTVGSVSRPRRRPTATGAAAPPEHRRRPPRPPPRRFHGYEPDLTALKAVDLAGRLQLGSLRLGAGSERRRSATGPGRWSAHPQAVQRRRGRRPGDRQRRARCPSATGPLSGAQAGAGGRCAAADPGPDRPAGRQGDLEVEAQGSGLSEQALRSRMQGKVSLRLSDGALHGINLAEMIREARATLTGKGRIR